MLKPVGDTMLVAATRRQGDGGRVAVETARKPLDAWRGARFVVSGVCEGRAVGAEAFE